MSRIVVKNLPSETTEDDLSSIFRQKGTLTAVDLMRNPSGKSRHFAFIGYHDEHDADEAIRSLNHTFIKTNKIQVEKCHALSKGQTPKKPKPTPKGKVMTKGLKRKFRLEERPVLKNKFKKGNLGPPVVEQILVKKTMVFPDENLSTMATSATSTTTKKKLNSETSEA